MRRAALRILLAACVVASSAVDALAQTFLRPQAVVEDTAIRVGDLFDNAGARAEVVVTAAPAPGRRMVIEASQLLSIARANGLAWRPVSQNDRVVVERPGRPLPAEEIVQLIRADLARFGVDQDADLDLGGFSLPMVPLHAFPQIAVEGITYEAVSQRFAATLNVAAEGMASIQARIAGRVVPTLPAVVATRRMAAGEVLTPTDVRLIRMRSERVRPGTPQSLEEAVGRQLRRPVGADMPLASADLTAPAVVERNGLVTMTYEVPGLTLSAQGRALEAGGRGAVVQVINLASRLVVDTRVIGPGRVQAIPGAVPSPPTPRQLAAANMPR